MRRQGREIVTYQLVGHYVSEGKVELKGARYDSTKWAGVRLP